MNFEAVQIARTARGISGTARALLLDLAIYANETGEAYASARKLADDLDVDVRRVRRLLHEVVSRGALKVSHVGTGRGNASTYLFAVKGGMGAPVSTKKDGSGATVSCAKGGTDDTLSSVNGGAGDTLSSAMGGTEATLSAENGGAGGTVFHEKRVAKTNEKGWQNRTEKGGTGAPPSKGSKGKLDARARARGRQAGRDDADTAEAAARWWAVLDKLRGEIDRESFATWLEPLACRRLDSRRVVLAAPTGFVRQWVRNNFADRITEAARAVLGVGQAPALAVVVGGGLDEGQGDGAQPCRIIAAGA